MKRISKKCDKTEIIDLCNIENKYANKLNDRILLNYKNAKKINANYNNKITDVNVIVNHMTDLKVLFASGNCGINDFGLSKVNIEIFDVDDNKYITYLNHMTNLKKISAW